MTYGLIFLLVWGVLLLHVLFRLWEYGADPGAGEIEHSWVWQYFHRRCRNRHCRRCDERWSR